ncbi:MAG: NADH-quinone oxidoreductase subunit H, partial [Candidatus Limnocylindria bacterium]
LRLARAPGRRLARPDALLWESAVAVAAASVVLAYAVVPLGPSLVPTDLSLGLFFAMIVLGPLMVAFMDAGWGSNGKLGVVASFRAAAHVIGYEVTFGFAVLGPAMMAGSLSAVRIVEAQERVWFVLLQPGSFAIYLASALLLAYRYPFDLPFAGPELAGGIAREYAGLERAVLSGVRHALLGVVAATGTIMFLGGWQGPVLPPAAWTVLKTAALVAALTALPLALPRLRLDQMLAFSWKAVLPFALVNIVVVGIVTFAAETLGWLP